MLHDILVFLPLVTLIVMALITRRMAESVITACLMAMVLLYGGNVLTGTVESIYGTLSDPSYQFVIMILIGFGGMIKVFQESGALLGFADWVSRFASGPKKPLIFAWFMAVVMFVDDYLNTLTVTFALKDITDQNRIPREHLAFQANAVASCLCVVIPFSSWTAFSIGLLSVHGLGFDDFVASIPYMFYPIIMLALCLLIALGLFPKVGALKESYARVRSGGPVLMDEPQMKSLVNIETVEGQKPSSALNAIVPILVMVAGVLIFDNDLIHGLILAIVAQFLMYTGQRLMTIGEFFEKFFDGARSMTSLIIVICFGFMLSAANEELGFFEILIGGVGETVPGWMLPVLAFILVGFTTFATGGCWVMQIIAVPIFIPLAQAAGIPVQFVIAAIMSGVTMGYGCCFYADAVFMTSAGTGVSNLRIIKTSAPYAIGTVILTAAGYLVCGLIAG